MKIAHGFVALALCALGALMAGCVSQEAPKPRRDVDSGFVSARAIESGEATTYPEAERGKVYFGPSPFEENRPPEYPQSLLDDALGPISVRIRLVIDERGGVEQSIVLPTNSVVPREFFDAVHLAVQQWRFIPLVRVDGGSGTTVIPFHHGSIPFEGKATALRFHQDYEFTFTLSGGVGHVGAAQGPSEP